MIQFLFSSSKEANMDFNKFYSASSYQVAVNKNSQDKIIIVDANNDR